MRPTTLTIVIGAGASYDCVSQGRSDIDLDYRPPLTNDIFASRRSFNGVLHKYQKVEALTDEIRTKLARGLSIEQLLREFADERIFVLRKNYFEIPFYLQELLGEISFHYVRTGSTKFATLFRMILRSEFKQVLLITLNYDLFLEKAITALTGHTFVNLSSYFPTDQKWMLLKLHGSVLWGRPLLNSPAVGSTTGVLDALNEEPSLAAEIRVLRGHQDEQRTAGGLFHFPCLAVPLDRKKQFACPTEQVEKAREFIRDCAAFLILGYSGLDLDVLELLGVAREVRAVKVVDESKEGGLQVLKRIAAANPLFGQIPPVNLGDAISERGFEQFMSSGESERFFDLPI